MWVRQEKKASPRQHQKYSPKPLECWKNTSQFLFMLKSKVFSLKWGREIYLLGWCISTLLRVFWHWSWIFFTDISWKSPQGFVSTQLSGKGFVVQWCIFKGLSTFFLWPPMLACKQVTIHLIFSLKDLSLSLSTFCTVDPCWIYASQFWALLEDPEKQTLMKFEMRLAQLLLVMVFPPMSWASKK